MDTSIDILIPCRNEELNIRSLLESVFKQKYTNFKVYVYDDESTDRSLQIVNEFKFKYSNQLTIVPTKPKPTHWLGKSWACHQLAVHSRASLMLFIDADTKLLRNHSIHSIVSIQSKLQSSLLSIWPDQIIPTFGLQLIIPWVYKSIFTHLPLSYQNKKPRWMPSLFYRRTKTKFGAANGQCLIFTRKDYHKTNPHQAVKSTVLEDVMLSKLYLSKELCVVNIFNTNLISCKMYHTLKQGVMGFRKNILEGFNNSIFKISFAGFWFILCYVVPFVFLYDRKLFFVSILIITLSILIDILFRKAVDLSPKYSFFSSLGVLLFCVISFLSIMDFFKLSTVEWKGRKLNK